MEKVMESLAYYGQKRGSSILTKEDLTEMYPDFNLSKRLNNLKDHSFLPSECPEDDPMAIELKEKLLSIGGTRIIMPRTDEDLAKTLSRGQFWLGDKPKLMIGQPSQCHYNSSCLYEANKNTTNHVRICTGYALSDDGIWRMHSWCIWAKPRVNKIIETTVERVLYYGFVMNKEECEEFSSWY